MCRSKVCFILRGWYGTWHVYQFSVAVVYSGRQDLIFQHKRPPRVTKYKKYIFWVHIRVLWSSFPLLWKPNILLVNQDTWWQHQMLMPELRYMTGQVGGFQNPGVCLQAFPSFPLPPLPALLLTPFFARSLTLVPRSLLLNRTETLAT